MLYKDKKRRLGDRYDGFKVRTLDTQFQLVPYLMRSRLDSQVCFEDEIDITEVEHFIREHRRTDMKHLSLLLVFMSAIVRMYAIRPRLNRFVAGKHIYARNNLRLALTVKRNLTVDGEELTVIPEFDPADTMYDVCEKFATIVEKEIQAAEEAEASKGSNKTDITAKAIGACPSFIKSIIVSTARSLDKIGLMPKVINRASPFHTSAFITDMGSLGIGPVFHHLYEFGTCSIFFAMGKKETKYVTGENGEIKKIRTVGIKIVADERICDGYYYATSIRMLKKLIKHPEQLLLPPEAVFEDDSV